MPCCFSQGALVSEIAAIEQNVATFDKQATDLFEKAMRLDETVNKTISGVCKKVGGVAPPLCTAASVVKELNPARQKLLDQVASVKRQILDLKKTLDVDKAKLNEANAHANRLDNELQQRREQLNKRMLQTAADRARATLSFVEHVHAEARTRLEAAQKTRDFINEYLCIWKGKPTCS